MLAFIICVPTAGVSAPSVRAQFYQPVSPAQMAPETFGRAARGCLAGAQMMPPDGPGWQTMRLSRNRYWGHPEMISFLKKLGQQMRDKTDWPGILVGDIALPRGGLVKGHASHQTGLDADLWFQAMPDHHLSYKERETMNAPSMVAKGGKSVDYAKFTKAHLQLLKFAASNKAVDRILVHPTIKKALCDATKGRGSWLKKIRPYYNHRDHMHLRLKCPKSSRDCLPQAAIKDKDTCGSDLDWWFTDAPYKPTPKPKPGTPKPKPLTLADWPAQCQTVLKAD